MFDVVCVGQAVLDCITRGKETAPYKPNVYRAETIRLHTGGDAVNESWALAAMGFQVAVVCGVGRDLAGDILLSELTKAGVNTDRVRRMEMDTPIANLQVARDGSRISVNSEATRLPGYSIAPQELPEAKIISFASIFRPPLEDPVCIKALLQTAKQKGSIVSVDTKLPLSGALRLDDLAEILPLIDYIFPNEKEAAYYTGRETIPEMAHALRDAGIRNVIIKTGPDGCYCCNAEEEFALPALPVPQVVDTTGAGDHFVAGFLSGILQQASFRDCATLGLQQAARAIMHTGGGNS
ncbi:MAG: carbohydrate kinase family protein [Oscillospiraceae bacterium]|nr:carbohydrate kinase family protein [Oscillospiraceae bacterium]